MVNEQIFGMILQDFFHDVPAYYFKTWNAHFKIILKKRLFEEVIQKTRQQKWYSEDMFVRFKINGCIGTVNGINPLKGKL